MWKFKDLPYERYEMDAFLCDANALLDVLEAAESFAEAKQALLDCDLLEQRMMTVVSLCHIRHDMDTNDPFYDAEMTYWNKNLSRLMPLQKRKSAILVRHRFRKELEEEFGSFLFQKLENEEQLADERLIPDATEEKLLVGRYGKLTAGAKTVFRGEECNFYKLLKYLQSTDRAVRKSAFTAWAGLYESISEELDSLYDQLIARRVHQAELLGFPSYTELAYKRRERFDYDAEDAARFRKAIADYVVPVCTRLRKAQAERIGVDKLRYYDESFFYAEGNPTPIGKEADSVRSAQEMYRALSKETGEFFDFMAEHGSYDLTSRSGKRMGGYCTQLPDYRSPFIFSNFNGTSADVDVLTHEAGHAFQGFLASRSLPLSDQWHAPMEICEVHSMSMEHFTYPWMDKFFGDDAKRYLRQHLTEAFLVLPYLVAVDEFQHRVYAKPFMTREERYAVWAEIEKIYLPWRDYDGNAFLEKGGFWMQKQHIFASPFYYIEYALAQTCAFDFYLRMREDREEAWASYLDLCKAGGKVGYFALLKIAKLRNPFLPETVRDIAAAISELTE